MSTTAGWTADDFFKWTPEALARLRQEWGAGTSTAKIGALIGCTKNAVIGKARRIGLTRRKNPVRPKRLATTTTSARLAEAKAKAAVRAKGVAPPLREGERPCSWPIGHPGERGFRFCDAPAIADSSYCAEHHRKAHVRINPDAPLRRLR